MAVFDRRPFILSLIPVLCLTACPSDGGDADAGLSLGNTNGETGITVGEESNSNSGNETPGDGDPDTGDGDGDGDPGDGDDDPTDGTNTKFDLAPIGDGGSGQGGWTGPGSCRSSEIYGASGNFPTYEDPAYEDFLDRTIAIVTHNNYDGPPNNFSLTVVDISGDPPPPNLNYLAPLYHHPDWTLTGPLGKNFGLTLDSYGNMYLAATTVWGANSTPDEIKRIDAVTGEITVFATLPNNGPGFGNINYDCVSESFYISNHEDGRIYQLDMDGDIVSTYDHETGDVTLGPANEQGEPNAQFATLGQRPWAVQSNAGRLYYSVWASGAANAVWSVAYEGNNGIPDPSTAKMEFTQASQPISDISFAHNGTAAVGLAAAAAGFSGGRSQASVSSRDTAMMARTAAV